MSKEFYLLVLHVLWTGLYDGLLDVFKGNCNGIVWRVIPFKGHIVKKRCNIFELSLYFLILKYEMYKQMSSYYNTRSKIYNTMKLEMFDLVTTSLEGKVNERNWHSLSVSPCPSLNIFRASKTRPNRKSSFLRSPY